MTVSLWRRRVLWVAILLVAVALGALVPLVARAGDGVATGRLEGATRIETAVAISQRAFPSGASVAYLARADQLADAVAAGSLTDGPVLLVPSCGDLPQAVADELARLAPTQVLALGGEAAICEELLQEAAAAVPASPGDPAAVVVEATAEITESSTAPPFTVDATDPGVVTEGDTVAYQVRFTGTGATVTIDDPRLADVLRDGDGQLVTAGRGCGPMVSDEEPGVMIACTDDLQLIEVREGETTPVEARIHTDDSEVGPAPLLPGTYALDQTVRWDDADEDLDVDDGEAVVRVTFDVHPASEQSRLAVVEWETADGSTYSTDGHDPASLARIEDAVAAGEAAGIPAGTLRWGDGGVNLGHVWHVTDVELADATIEVCDGTAAMVDEDPQYWVETVGALCPWSAVPTAVHHAGV